MTSSNNCSASVGPSGALSPPPEPPEAVGLPPQAARTMVAPAVRARTRRGRRVTGAASFVVVGCGVGHRDRSNGMTTRVGGDRYRNVVRRIGPPEDRAALPGVLRPGTLTA